VANVIDYLSWRGDLPFKKSCINEVDVVILSQIVMLDLSKSVPKEGSATLKECAEKYFSTKHKTRSLGFIIPDEINNLYEKMAETARFSKLKLSSYIEDIDLQTEVQFSALTVDAEEVKTRFVIFSGTDDTIVGWKENFNLIYKTPTTAQIKSVEYLNTALDEFSGKVIVLGHSKGGHLAMYSSANCKDENRKKIISIFNLDGPGMPENEKDTQKFVALEKRVLTLLPQESIIGKLLEHGENYKIIHSTGKGLFQHDCLSWQVMGARLVEEKEFTPDAVGISSGFRTVLSEMDKEERELFVEGVFDMLYKTKCKTLTELAANGKEIVKCYFKIDAKKKSAVNRATLKLLKDKYLRKLILGTSISITKLSSSNEEVKKIKQENKKRIASEKVQKKQEKKSKKDVK